MRWHSGPLLVNKVVLEWGAAGEILGYMVHTSDRVVLFLLAHMKICIFRMRLWGSCSEQSYVWRYWGLSFRGSLCPIYAGYVRGRNKGHSNRVQLYLGNSKLKLVLSEG